MSIKLPLILSMVAVVFKGRADLIAENLALRHINFRVWVIGRLVRSFGVSTVSFGCCCLASGAAGGKV